MITLKTLPEATAQEVYNQVKAHLLSQNCKSSDGLNCLYRGTDGTKCAAGILIGDDEYGSEMEHKTWQSLVYNKLVLGAYALLITALQNVHDDCFVENWESRLKDVAIKYNLEP